MVEISINAAREFWRKHTVNGVPKVTERQHYVPVHYLEAWRTGRKIAAKIGDNPPKMIGIRNVAVKSWCYEFAPLSLVELETIIDCASPKSDYERRMLSMLLTVGVIPQLAGRLANDRNDSEAELMLNTIKDRGYFIPEAEQLFSIRYLATLSQPKLANDGFELLRKEGGERYVTGLENEAWPYLKVAREGRLEFMKNPKRAIRLLEYLFLQMFRTPKLDAVLSSPASRTEFPANYARNMVPYLRFIFAIKTTCEAVAHWEEFEFKLVRNNTGCNFITSDYPFAHLDKSSFHEFVFPLSPKLALYMGRRGKMRKLYPYLMHPTCVAIEDINREIKKHAASQIFACSCNEL